MFTSCFFGRTEWNRTVYFIRRIFLRWAAARHTQLFLLFLSNRLKSATKTQHEIIYCYILPASLSWTGWQVNRGSLFTHLHIGVWKPNATAFKHDSSPENDHSVIIYSPKLHDFPSSVECKNRPFLECQCCSFPFDERAYEWRHLRFKMTKEHHKIIRTVHLILLNSSDNYDAFFPISELKCLHSHPYSLYGNIYFMYSKSASVALEYSAWLKITTVMMLLFFCFSLYPCSLHQIYISLYSKSKR